MKLLFCEKCWDVFKLTTKELRSCSCGLVKGKYNEDGHTSENNGKGISFAIDNNYVYNAIGGMQAIQKAGFENYDNFYNDCRIPMWVRPNEGVGNPRSKVVEDL